MTDYNAAKAEAFAGKMVDTLNGASTALMLSLGHRTGLFDAMAGQPPRSSSQIATAAGRNERYVREWLGAMVTSGVVEHDGAANSFRLPPEHAAVLTRAARPNNMAAAMQWVGVLGAVEDDVADAFEHGRGVPYSRYRRFHEVMAEESDQTTVAGLEPHILPLVPGLVERLDRGIDVLDVGCGAGQAMLHLAGRFRNSRFRGRDFSPESIQAAKANARNRNLTNVQFDVGDAARLTECDAYDLVTAFDAIHDQAQPAAVLSGIARAVKPAGVFLMQDIKACSHLAGNRNLPLGPFTYTISCMHCMSVSLANGGPGLGAAWGRELATTMLHDAGLALHSVSELPHDPLNYYYIAHRTSVHPAP